MMTDRVDVAVSGGALATFRLGAQRGEPPLVLAIHGITANSRGWRPTARALGDRAALLAVDLRGRGRSNALPEPFGLSTHARDMIAVLDHFSLDRPVVVGHSLGAYVAARLAAEYPARIRGLVLVDGGLRLPGSEGTDPERIIEASLGPAIARLKMTFPDAAAYRTWWGEHPALVGSDIDPHDLDEYAAHDLVGEAPRLRSSVNPQVVRDDGIELFDAADADTLSVPAVFLCAPGGLLGDANPMQPLEQVEAWAAADPTRRRGVQVPHVNHYTIALGRAGAEAVADEIARMLAATDAVLSA